jgi:hypothetical protein
MSAKKLNLVIRQGETFQRVVRWEMLPLIYKPISGIAQNAPVQITAANHGCPAGWRATVKDAGGMDEINAKNWPPRSGDFHRVAVESSTVVNFNDVSAVNFDPYTSGGYLVYYTPVPLAGFTARMKIRDRIGGTVLVTLVSPTDIVIDTALGTITVVIAASASELFTWTRGVYDLELVSGAGVVTAILTGAVTVTKEVTTS